MAPDPRLCLQAIALVLRGYLTASAGPPRARTEVNCVDLGYWAISGSIHLTARASAPRGCECSTSSMLTRADPTYPFRSEVGSPVAPMAPTPLGANGSNGAIDPTDSLDRWGRSDSTARTAPSPRSAAPPSADPEGVKSLEPVGGSLEPLGVGAGGSRRRKGSDAVPDLVYRGTSLVRNRPPPRITIGA